MTHRLLIIGLFAGVASAAVAGGAFADPPARVGRIAYAEGDVSFQPTQDQDWTYAAPNYPVTGGQAFWTGDNGRVELQVGGIEADLDSETEVDVTSLHYGDMRLGVSQGSLSVDIRGMPVGGVTVSTPAGDVHLRGRGFYRVDVGAPQDDGGYPPAAVSVFQGEADAPGPQGFMQVESGQSATLYAGYDPQLQDVQDTAIDDWARERLRDERWEGNPPELEGMTGAADLARYGDFVDSPQFGTVWFPRDVDPDWAPYREGRWDWIAPWGYTWIDDAPWGFAPFHYGRWARLDGRWAWIPGQANAQPVWAPALVTFIGGLGGALGWIPLAPDEVYQPPYTVSDEYFRRANVANVNRTTFNTVVVNRTVTNITVNNYHNAPAVTVMRADALRSGAPVREARAQISMEAIARAPVVLLPTVEAPPPARPRTGLPRPGSSAGPAAAPPPRLAATRAAIAAPNPGANHPPVIAGARRAPPPPPAPQGGPRPSLIAPAQARNPAAQHRQPPAAPGMSAPAAPPSHPRSVARPPPAGDEMNATAPSAARPPRDRPPAPSAPRNPSAPPAADGMNATPPPAPRPPRDRSPPPSAPRNPSAPPAADGMNATPPPAPRTPRDRPPAPSAPRNPSAPPAPDGMNATPPPAPKTPHARPPSSPSAPAGRPAAPAPTAGPPPSPPEAQARRKAAEKAAAAKAAQSPPGSPQPPHP